MSVQQLELVVRGVRAQWRSAMWWTLGIAAVTLLNVAFWPSLEGTEALTDIEESVSPELLEAFGAQDLGTAAGYLDGELYALMLPILLSGVAIGAVSAITSGDESAGRLELLHALPVRRQAVWGWRFASTLLVLAIITVLLGSVILATRDLFSLEEVGAGRIAAATSACALLAAFHAAVAYAVGGAGGARGAAVGGAIVVLLAGYVANFLFPLSDALDGLRRVSPWYWAIGEQPVSNGVSWSSLGLLVVVSAALVALGTAAVGRRDIRGV